VEADVPKALVQSLSKHPASAEVAKSSCRAIMFLGLFSPFSFAKSGHGVFRFDSLLADPSRYFQHAWKLG